LSRGELERICAAVMASISGIACIAALGLVSNEVSFGRASNFTTSGGFGPNQVASVLGLAALLAFLWQLQERITPALRVVLFAAILWFVAQSAITFSRGGLYFTGIAAAIAGVFYLGSRRGRMRLSALAVAVVIVGGVGAAKLDSYTSGRLSARFHDTDMTGRDLVVRSDVEAWKENPLFGVGPGQLLASRREQRMAGTAHTEFSRLLADHGTLGLGAVIVLVAMLGLRFLRAKSAEERAVVLALSAWSVLFMAVNAMRLVAPSYIFGLACAGSFGIQPGVLGLRRRRLRLSRFSPRSGRQIADSQLANQ
jgi:O-antigen ligase